MNIITTKYEFGQELWPICREKEQVWIPCPECGGKGTLTGLTGKSLGCPECYGHKGKTEWRGMKWQVQKDRVGHVGQIRVEVAAKRYQRNNPDKVTYMLDSTGVGTGTLWDENQMFASLEEAQAECDRRNSEPCPA